VRGGHCSKASAGGHVAYFHGRSRRWATNSARSRAERTTDARASCDVTTVTQSTRPSAHTADRARTRSRFSASCILSKTGKVGRARRGPSIRTGAAGASRAARFAANYLRLPGQAQSGVDSPRCRSTSSAGANGAAVARAIGSDPAPGGRRAGEGRWAAASVPRPCGRSIGRASGPHPTETWPSRICTGHVSYCVHGLGGKVYFNY
jgi:hypothetical protein